MDRARLGGIDGAGEVRARRRSETAREYRGVFAFPREHEAELVELLAARAVVEYEGLIDGARRLLKVRVTDLALQDGIAAFQGVGEPYGESDEVATG